MKLNILKKIAALGLSTSLLISFGLTAMAEEQATPDVLNMRLEEAETASPEVYKAYCKAHRGLWGYDEDDIKIPDDGSDFDEIISNCPKGYYLRLNEISVINEQSYEEAKKNYNDETWWQIRYCKINYCSACPDGYGCYIDNILLNGKAQETYDKLTNKVKEGNFESIKYRIIGKNENRSNYLLHMDEDFEYFVKNCPDGYCFYVNYMPVKDDKSYAEAKKIFDEKNWWQIMYLKEDQEINFDFMMKNCSEGYRFYVDNRLVNEESYEELKKIYEDNKWSSLYYINETLSLEEALSPSGSGTMPPSGETLPDYEPSPSDNGLIGLIEIAHQNLPDNDLNYAPAVNDLQAVTTPSSNAAEENTSSQELTTQDRQSAKTSDSTDTACLIMLASALCTVIIGIFARKKCLGIR